jgi:ribosomal protein S18 acetylase RimI-like enzyme
METIGAKIRVTYMQAVAPPQSVVELPRSYAIKIAHLNAQEYLKIYKRVGTQVNWDSRLKLSESQLTNVLSSPINCLILLMDGNQQLGMCEFTATNQQVELTHFGLVPEMQGRRLGYAFLSNSLDLIWQPKPSRVWLHTDEWDSPAAQILYKKAGFRIFDQRLEDPGPL